MGPGIDYLEPSARKHETKPTSASDRAGHCIHMQSNSTPGEVKQMKSPPSLNGANGRNANGRFQAGNPGGPGNPHSKQVNEIRAALINAVTPKDVQAIVKRLVKEAKAGNIHAAREVLDRCLGKSKQSVDIDIEGDFDRDKWRLVPNFNQMSDIEIIQTIEDAGLEMPPLLKKKAELIKQQHRMKEQSQCAAEPTNANEEATKRLTTNRKKKKAKVAAKKVAT